MSEETERIAAADFARQRGLKESAVVHRIRAGIYPGTHEDGVWYVFRGPARAGAAVVSTLPPERPPVQIPEPELPWTTVEGPFPWVLWVVIGGLVLTVLSAFAIPVNAGLAGISIGTLMTVMFASMVYEGVRTGTVRGRVFDYEYKKRPFGYVFQMSFNVFMSVMGLFLIGVGVSELFH